MTIYRGTGTTSNGEAIEDYLASKVERSGDTMTGPLNVPAGAAGTQVPQKGEVDTAISTAITAAKINTALTGTTTAADIHVGNVGTEGGGVVIGGVNYESTFKVSDINGVNLAQTIFHRHSTTLEPVIVAARSNDNTTGHTNMTNDQGLFSLVATGTAGTDYKIFGIETLGVDSTGTVSGTSAPGKWSLKLTPNGSVIPVEVVSVNNAGVMTATVKNTPAGNIAATTIQAAINELDTEKEAVANKDATGGYAGLTLFKINFKNVANTFTSFFTNSNTAARTYTFQDRDGTIADVSDITTVYGRKNLVINGAFDIAQRNTTYALTTTFAYGCVDRWGFAQATTAACTASQVAIATSGIPFRYGLKLQRTAAATTTGVISSTTAFETTDSVKFAGKQVTLSFWAKAGANYSAASSILNLAVITGTGTDQANAADPSATWTGAATPLSVAQVITTTLTKYTVTGTIAAGATQIAVMANWTPVGTAGADDSVTITGVQFEVGATATDFEFRSIQHELELSQRYYQKLLAAIFGGWGNSTTEYFTVVYPVVMRVAPTMSYQNTSYTAGSTLATNLSSAAHLKISFVITAAGGYGYCITDITSDAEL